jgi:ribonuclease P protein component
VPDGEARFRRTERLLESKDFRRLGASARRLSSAHFVMLIAAARELEGATGQRRLGITASRKLGGAVERNRVKRQVRDWFRRSKRCLAPGTEVVVIARKGAQSLHQREVDAELGNLAAAGR